MENKVLSPGIPEEASALIVVKQLPIIEQRLQKINAEITERVTTALKLAVTEETVKSVKKVRADLKKTFTELETCRKDVKAAVLAPYQEFEAAYKKYVTDVFKPADEQLAGKIAEVEEGLKAKIGQEIAEYYDELASSLGIDFLPFGMSGISITLSASKKALREQANKLLVQISENMSMIENQDHAEEILVEYKKDPFNVARAISTVQERHRAIGSMITRISFAPCAKRNSLTRSSTCASARNRFSTAPTVGQRWRMTQHERRKENPRCDLWGANDMLADNRLAEMSYNDLEAVQRELAFLDEMGFDISLTGFDLDEVQKEAEQLERELRRKNAPPSSLMDTFLVPPFSVLDTRQGYWQDRKRQWLDFGIKSEVGRGDNLTFAKSLQMTRNDNGTSVFDPVLCEIMYRWFNTPGGLVFDPFAGGSVRGVVAKCTGSRYMGIDLRSEQIESNLDNAEELSIDLDGLEWICDDSLNMDKHIGDSAADMIFTCPPYFDLEVYSDDPRDISNMSYEGFTDTFHKIMAKAARKLKDNRFMVVVISDVRGPDGGYRGITDSLTRLLRDQGLVLYNDMILLNVVGSGSLRVRRNMRNRKVVRTHQNVLVYYKGDTGAIQETFPELTEITEENLPDGLDM